VDGGAIHLAQDARDDPKGQRQVALAQASDDSRRMAVAAWQNRLNLDRGILLHHERFACPLIDVLLLHLLDHLSRNYDQ
jgi:hypothetical protein